MKKLNFSVRLILLATCIASCTTAPKTQIISGVVYDASMNNITVITNIGDTVHISTMNTDPQKVPGVLLNDSIQVTCQDKDFDGIQVLTATELQVLVHSPYYFIQGTWTEPNPIKPEEQQGFTLNQDGTATSIHMATLNFTAWTLNNRTLTLNFQSIGNRQTIEGIDTLQIVKIDADSLVLSNNGNIIWRMAKQKID